MSNEKKDTNLSQFKTKVYNDCKNFALDCMQIKAVSSNYQEAIHGIREKWLYEGLKIGFLLGSFVLWPKYRLLTGVAFVVNFASSVININNLKVLEKARVGLLQNMLKNPVPGGVPPVPDKGNLN